MIVVSVLIPAYNAEKTLKRCLDSVCGQTYREIETVVVDDGSSDQTLEIAKQYAIEFSFVRVCSQQNKGVAAARNAGLMEATGDFILYVDADDWIEPEMIERMLSLAKDADIVFCGNDQARTPQEAKHESNVSIEVWDQQQQLLEFMLHKRMTGMLWNKLIRRSITEGLGFNENTGYGEDAEFLWKVLKRSEKMVVTNEILYHHVIEENSISHLSFSSKKYSAIPMWEEICADTEKYHPQLRALATERLMCAAVFSEYEIRRSGYKNVAQKKHIQQIVRNNINLFLRSDRVSTKMKLFAVAVSLGY